MYEIKKLDVWVTTRYAVLFTFIGSVIFSGVAFMLFALDEYGSFAYDYGYRSFRLEDLLPFGITPLFATFLGFVFTASFCALYNVIAQRTQGIQVELEFVPEEDSKRKPV